jgi:hypothetical protein
MAPTEGSHDAGGANGHESQHKTVPVGARRHKVKGWPSSPGPIHPSSRLGASSILTSSTISINSSQAGENGGVQPMFGTRMNAQGVPQRTPNTVNCFDDSKLTRNAVAYAHDSIFRSPIDRIGMYISPHAMHLTMSATRESIPGSMFSSPGTRESNSTINRYREEPLPDPRNQKEAIASCAAFTRSRTCPLQMTDNENALTAEELFSHERYNELVQAVDVESRVVPIKMQWMKNACHWAQLESFPSIPEATKVMVAKCTDDDINHTAFWRVLSLRA